MRKSFWTLLQISDTHLFSSPRRTLCGLNTDSSFQSLKRSILQESHSVDAFLVSGDISQDGSLSAYRRFARHMSGFRHLVFALPGNHDHVPTLKRAFKNGAVQAKPEMQLGNWKILLLDSAIPGRNEGRFRQSELQRLRNFLARHKKQNLIISFHHNPIPVGSKWMDQMTLENTAEFHRILRPAKNVRAVVFGHIHQAFEKQINGILYLGVPSACLQFRPRTVKMELDRRPPGYRLIRLFTNGRIETVIKRIKNYKLKPDFRATGY